MFENRDMQLLTASLVFSACLDSDVPKKIEELYSERSCSSKSQWTETLIK